MRLEFMERQQTLTICKGGRQALVLLNENEEKRERVSPDGEKTEVTVFTYDATWLDLTKLHDPVAAAREEVLKHIEAYDTSSAVNGFVLNGAEVWLDKSTRVGLMNSTTIAKAMGQATTTLWLGDTKLEVGCDMAIQLLSSLEMYALECFNVTAAHKAAVEKLQTVEEVLAYDYTAGYPKILEMSV